MNFEYSKFTKNNTATIQENEPAYVAPEALLEEGFYNSASDIWSLGVLFYRLIFGVVPFIILS